MSYQSHAPSSNECNKRVAPRYGSLTLSLHLHGEDESVGFDCIIGTSNSDEQLCGVVSHIVDIVWRSPDCSLPISRARKEIGRLRQTILSTVATSN